MQQQHKKVKKVDTKLVFVSVLEKKRNKNHFEIYKNYFHVKLVHHEKNVKEVTKLCVQCNSFDVCKTFQCCNH